MNEFELIDQLTRALPGNSSVIIGAGDDCAVLDFGLVDRVLLFKTDAVVEGIHFTPETPPEKIGHKALARCLSDIAAMAGTPTAALVTIALPRTFDPESVAATYAGMNALARRHEVAIVGGETTTNPERILISVALLGWAPRGKAILRSGSKVGDAIFVTGELGGSRAGKHLEFEPRLEEARWLAQHFTLHAMIDLSDGLAGDLRHILKASHVGAELLSNAIPISAETRRAAKAKSSAKPPLLSALADGEDFELLFTLPSRNAVPLLDAWKRQFPKLRLTCIGRTTAGESIIIQDKNGARPLNVHGYVISHSPIETEALGETWGRAAEIGLVIGLCGDLGAGKTQLVKGLARGLSIPARVHSPTFTLINIYTGGRLVLFHLDLYRLDTYEQILAAGLDEYLQPQGVTVIEWADRWFGVSVQSLKSKVQGQGTEIRKKQESSDTDGQRGLPRRFRWVEIETVSETDRRITYEDIGT